MNAEATYLEAQHTILIIDDTPTNLEVLHNALSDAGYEVLVEMDGQNGLNQALSTIPDLILLDVMMPGIDGFETCRRLKANAITHDIPVIFMTALMEVEHKVMGFNVGGVDYITKPFQQDEVLARVKMQLQFRRMAQELETQNQLLKSFNTDLETVIAERTQALNKANMQLIQQEKLSALGQMVAGVAHEINNPVNFIYGNCRPAHQYISQLLDLIQLYQVEYPQPTERLRSQITQIDLNFLMQDLPKVIQSMEIGADRIHQIVTSLRSFSRLDEAELKRADLHEGIENTLLILQHRLQGERPIGLLKNYGNIPLVNCFPGQVNQVLMNLLVNAIDAIGTRMENQIESNAAITPGEITIQTKVVKSDYIAISINDNGTGISENTQAKLFEPFFTTKPIGKGTGLGLSISYQIIVENHYGELICQSRVGQGTEFTVLLPIDVAQLKPELAKI
jgi:two-component system, NtrC family, sensor kinase